MIFIPIVDNISISVNISRATPVILEHALHGNPSVFKNERDQVHISQDIYCECF